LYDNLYDETNFLFKPGNVMHLSRCGTVKISWLEF